MNRFKLLSGIAASLVVLAASAVAQNQIGRASCRERV